MSVEDVEAIKQLKARYFRLLDQQRWDELVDVFTTDVEIDVTDDSPDGHMSGSERFVGVVSARLAGSISAHHGHMPEIALTGPDGAIGVWSMRDEIHWPDGGPLRGTGWYEEEYRRTAAGWRIARMRLRRQRVELGGEQIFPRV